MRRVGHYRVFAAITFAAAHHRWRHRAAREVLKSPHPGRVCAKNKLFASLLVVAGLAGCTSTNVGSTTSSSYTTMDKSAQSAMTADSAIAALKDGNKRFVSGNMIKRDLMKQVKATGYAQHVSFADSSLQMLAIACYCCALRLDSTKNPSRLLGASMSQHNTSHARRGWAGQGVPSGGMFSAKRCARICSA